jgi:hypothetical protein
MPEPITFYDLEFHFTHGEPLIFTIQEGKDAIDERPEVFAYTVFGESTEERIEVYRERVNCRRCTKRLVKPKTDINGVLMEGE